MTHQASVPHRGGLLAAHVAMLIGLLVLSGCAAQAQGKADAPREWGNLPICGQIWQVGSQLPARYIGCQSRGRLNAATFQTCSNPAGRVTGSPSGHLWGELGQRIVAGSDATAACPGLDHN